MKKVFYILTTVLAVTLLTGCFNTKTLTCKKVDEELIPSEKVHITEKISYDTKNKTFGDLKYSLELDLNESSMTDGAKTSLINKMTEKFKETCNEYKKAKSCQVTSRTEYDVKITTVASREVIDAESANYSTLEELRSYYEGKGYTCKEE